jgi:hypothetical protein
MSLSAAARITEVPAGTRTAMPLMLSCTSLSESSDWMAGVP